MLQEVNYSLQKVSGAKDDVLRGSMVLGTVNGANMFNDAKVFSVVKLGLMVQRAGYYCWMYSGIMGRSVGSQGVEGYLVIPMVCVA